MMTEDDALNFFVQSGKEGMQWKGSTGSVKSAFAIPEPNCCYFYREINFGGLRSKVCWDLQTGKANTYPHNVGPVNSLDCGSRATMTIG